MSIVDEYRNIHRQMSQKYINNNNIKQEEQNASLLQEFLVNVKRMSLNRKLQLNIIDKIAFTEMVSQMQQQFIQSSPSNAKFARMFFHGTGSGFEKDITKLHQIAEKNLRIEFEKQMSKEQINIGNVSANILDEAGTIRITSALVESIEQNGSAAINELVGADFHKGIVKKGRSGKIDVRGNKEIIINYSSDNISTRIWQIIANSHFTLKNKKSLEWDNQNKQLAIAKTSDIHLGHTTPYVAILGALDNLEMNYSLEDKERLFYGGLIEGIDNNNKEIIYHLNHLQFIYDLSGVGQSYQGLGKLGPADYLIYNDPDSDDIQVKSVNSMIAQALNENKDVYSRYVSFARKNVAKNKMTEQAKKSYMRYKH